MHPKSAIRNPQSQMDEVHVWRFELHPADCDRLAQFLSPDELERAGRFRFPRDRDRFIARRGILRETLSRYVDRLPGDLCFEYSSFGKPRLAGEPVHFSVSHSNGLAVFAISSREVGVDIEHIRSDFQFLDIARRFFHDDEILYLDSLPALDRCRAFFSLWTRKEAYLKALGLGLNASLHTPAVPPMGEAQIADSEGMKWALADLEVGMDYAAALASIGDRPLIKLFG